MEGRSGKTPSVCAQCSERRREHSDNNDRLKVSPRHFTVKWMTSACPQKEETARV
jgi:hypothetical protein